MTDEQINATIAKELGWTQVEAIHRSGRAPGATYVGREFIPDYCTDLNAMHEAEKVLDYEQAESFADIMYNLCADQNSELENPMPWRFSVCHATARQRAEAFLKTLGKWEEVQG